MVIRGSTSNEPVAKITTDNGHPFGPVQKFAANGIIGESGEG